MEALAQRYAEALYELAQGEGVVEQIGQDLTLVGELWEGVPDLATFLIHPRILLEEKEDFLVRSLGGKVHPYTLNALRLLVRKGRAQLLPEIRRTFLKVGEQRGRLNYVLIRVAQEVAEDQLMEFKAHLEELLGRPVALEMELAPELIAGAEVEIAGRRIDASLRGRLERLGARLGG